MSIEIDKLHPDAGRSPGPWTCTLPDEAVAGGIYASDGSCVCDIYSNESNIADDAAPLEVAKKNTLFIGNAPYMHELLWRLFINSGYTNDSDKNLWENSEVSNEILQQVKELLKEMEGVRA